MAPGEDSPAIAQHGHAIADAKNLFQLVRDVDDRDASFFEASIRRNRTSTS